MFLKFEEPAIRASSTAPGHDGEIEVLSWNHGFAQPSGPARGVDRGSVEQASHQSLTFTKYLDSATNDLLKHCWSGGQFGKVTLACYRADGVADNKPVLYLTVTMQHVIISNYAVSGGPGDVPVENVSLDYGIVQYDYKPHSQPDTADALRPVKHNLQTGIIE
jgi:type VI secretion system secreted protein Hcp